MAKGKKNKKVPSRNYLIAVLTIAAVLLLTIYGFEWYKAYENEKLSTSYLMKSNTIFHEIKDLDSLDLILSEAPGEYFLYISYTNSRDIYNLEKDLKDVIEEHQLSDEFYFLNVTSIMDDEDFYKRLNAALDISFEIKTIPIILYFRDRALHENGIVWRENQLFKAGDFAQLIDMFEIGNR